MNTVRKTIFLIVLAVCAAGTMWAQLYSGSVTGVITDPSNAIVAGAKANLTDENRGLSSDVETDASGRYLFRAVSPGSYRITITAAGFQPRTQSGIRVDVNGNVNLDLALAVNAASTSIEVSATAPLLSSEDAATGQVLSRQSVDNLPISNRDVSNLTYLTPGVVAPFNGNPWGGNYGNAFSSSGGRPATTDVLMDGVSITNYEQNGGTLILPYMPAPDAIEEFKVQSSTFSAEFGFTGASVVNMVMRSGTNAVHGTAYEYLRNQKLDANNFFSNSAGQSLPALRRNNFGGVIDGPIKRNKTFFFADYDGLRQVSGQTANFGVPSAAERTGNFSELCGDNGGAFDSAGRCSAAAGQLWDPYSGAYNAAAGGAVKTAYIPFNNMATYVSPGSPNLNGSGYQLPLKAGNLIDPLAAKMMQYMPLPNYRVGTPGYQYYNNWIGSGSKISNHNQFDTKIDHRLDDATMLSGKFSLQHLYNHNWNCFQNVSDPCTAGPDTNHSYLGSLNVTHTFTPSLLLTVSYGYTRWSEREGSGVADYPNVDIPQTLGLPSYFADSGYRSMPSVTVGDAYSNKNGVSVGPEPWTYIVRGQDTHEVLGTLSWIKGSHEVKFGGELRDHLVNFTLPGPAAFNFDYSTTSQTPNSASGGDAMASFLTGVGLTNNGSYEVAEPFSSSNFQWGGFIQDNWKFSRNLTFNLGLRYDVTLPRTERYNRQNWVDLNVVSPLQVPGMGTLHGGEVFASSDQPYPYDPVYSNIQPRFGFAWKLHDKTVLRGGYGIYYSTSRAAAAGLGGTGTGHQGYVEDTVWTNTYHNDGATPWGRLSDPWPVSGPNLPAGNTLGLLNDVGYGAYGPVKNVNSVPYEQAWSMSVQRELPWNTLLEVSYVGKKGTHLYFGGSGNYDVLGQQAGGYSPDQVAGLLSYVPNPFYGIITDRNSILSQPTVQAYHLQLPYPQFTAVGTDDLPVANSIYHALQMRVEKRFSNGIQFLVTYTFSKSIDDASSSSNSWYTGSTSLQDPNNMGLERSVSNFDIPQVLQVSHVYELPFGHGKRMGANWNPVVNGVLGGWQLNGIWTFASGRPLTLGLQGGYSLPTYGSQRPDLVGTPSRNTGSDWLNNYFTNNSVFAYPAPYTDGTAPRTLPWVRTPGQNNANLSLFKEFSLDKVREGMKIQCRVQALNAFNHVQFDSPNTTVGSSSFGVISSQANSPRELEMALRFSF